MVQIWTLVLWSGTDVYQHWAWALMRPLMAHAIGSGS
jgi:hypothetical protein